MAPFRHNPSPLPAAQTIFAIVALIIMLPISSSDSNSDSLQDFCIADLHSCTHSTATSPPRVGFVDSATNKLYSSVIEPGDLAVFPRGQVHFQLNVGAGPALAQTAYSGEFPARPDEGESTFGSRPSIRNEVLSKAFGLSDEAVQQLKAFFSVEHFGLIDFKLDLWNNSLTRRKIL